MNNTFVYNPADRQTSTRLISKVFAYMFGGVLLTTLVAIVVGLGFTQWLYGTLDVSSATTVNEEAYSAILTMLIISSIALIVTTIVLNVFAFKGNHSLMIPALIYCVLMGLILSEFVIFLPWQILATAFGITCLIFGAMSLIGLLSKGSLNILATIGIGLLVGSALISLVGMIFLLTGALGTYMNLYWIVSFASFAGMMFITIWDISHLKQMAESGSMNKNLILYLAFNLYVDFIYILMRVIYFVAMVYSRNK